MANTWVDAILGNIQSEGVNVELEGALNFTSSLTATRNTASQRIDISPRLGWKRMSATLAAGGLVQEAYRGLSYEGVFLSSTANDDLQTTFPLPIERALNTEVRLVLTYIPMSAGAGTFAMSGTYELVNIGSELDAAWTAWSASASLVAGDQYKVKRLTLASFTPTTDTQGALIALHGTRLSTTTDTYDTAKDHGTAAANIMAIGVEVLYKTQAVNSEVYP